MEKSKLKIPKALQQKKKTRTVPAASGKYIRRAILDFAQKYGLVINPAGYERFVSNYYDFGFCVCDPTRKNCPCPESVKECENFGHCKCSLYWRDYKTFLEQMIDKRIGTQPED